MKRGWAVLAGVVVLGASAHILAQEKPVGPVDGKVAPIVGSWKLNKDMTDKPGAENARGGDGARIAGGMGGGMGGRGGTGIGGMGGGNRGGGYEIGRGRDPEEMKRVRALIADLTRPADGWIIVQNGALVQFTSVDGRTTKYTVDGKEEEHLTGDGVIKSKARWNGEQLVIEAKYQDGPRVTRTYTVSSDLRQLMIHIKISGGGAPREMTINHVYDRQRETRQSSR